VQTYACTYDNCKIEKLKQVYNLKKITVLPELNNIPFNFYPDNRCMVRTYLKALQAMQNEELDFIIIGRFDLYFKTDIIDSMRLDKFNFLFKLIGLWENVINYQAHAADKDWHFTADGFHAFPYHMLNDVIKSVEEILESSNTNTRSYTRIVSDTVHNLYEFIEKKIGNSNINFIHDKEYHMINNPVTALLRFKNPPDKNDNMQWFENDTLPDSFYV
jgi:hypothetical protein